jgi:sugar fermentation stimulation protein A
MLYFINREDCLHFGAGDAYDPDYGTLLRLGIEKGIRVLPCRFQVSPQGIRYLGLAMLDLG